MDAIAGNIAPHKHVAQIAKDAKRLSDPFVVQQLTKQLCKSIDGEGYVLWKWADSHLFRLLNAALDKLHDCYIPVGVDSGFDVAGYMGGIRLFLHMIEILEHNPSGAFAKEVEQLRARINAVDYGHLRRVAATMDRENEVMLHHIFARLKRPGLSQSELGEAIVDWFSYMKVPPPGKFRCRYLEDMIASHLAGLESARQLEGMKDLIECPDGLEEPHVDIPEGCIEGVDTVSWHYIRVIDRRADHGEDKIPGLFDFEGKEFGHLSELDLTFDQNHFLCDDTLVVYAFGKERLFLDRESFEVRYVIREDGQLYDGRGCALAPLSDPIVAGQDLSAIEHLRQIRYVAGDTLRLELMQLGLAFTFKDGMWASVEYPGYYLQPADLSQPLGSYQNVLTLRGGEGFKDVVVLVPTRSLNDALEWDLDEKARCVACRFVDGKLEAGSGLPALTLAYLNAALGKRVEALKALRTMQPLHIAGEECAAMLAKIEALGTKQGGKALDSVTVSALATLVAVRRQMQIDSTQMGSLLSDLQRVYTQSYLPALNRLSPGQVLTRGEELEILQLCDGGSEEMAARREALLTPTHAHTPRFRGELPYSFGKSIPESLELKRFRKTGAENELIEIFMTPFGDLEAPKKKLLEWGDAPYDPAGMMEALTKSPTPSVIKILEQLVALRKGVLEGRLDPKELALVKETIVFIHNQSKGEGWTELRLWQFIVRFALAEKRTIDGLFNAKPDKFDNYVRYLMEPPLVAYRFGNTYDVPLDPPETVERSVTVTPLLRNSLTSHSQLEPLPGQSDDRLSFTTADFDATYIEGLEALETKRGECAVDLGGIGVAFDDDPLLQAIAKRENAESLARDKRHNVSLVASAFAQFAGPYCEGVARLAAPFKYAHGALVTERTWAEGQLQAAEKRLHALSEGLLWGLNHPEDRPPIEQAMDVAGADTGARHVIDLHDLARFVTSADPAELQALNPRAHFDAEKVYKDAINMMLLSTLVDHYRDYIRAVDQLKSCSPGSPEAIAAERQYDAVLRQMAQCREELTFKRRGTLVREFFSHRRAREVPASQTQILEFMEGEGARADSGMPGAGKTAFITPIMVENVINRGEFALIVPPQSQYHTFVGLMAKELNGVDVVTFEVNRSQLTTERLRHIEMQLETVKHARAIGRGKALILTKNTIQTLVLEMVDVWMRLGEAQVEDRALLNARDEKFFAEKQMGMHEGVNSPPQIRLKSAELREKFAALQSIVAKLSDTTPVIDEAHAVLDILNKVNFPVGKAKPMNEAHANLLFDAFALLSKPPIGEIVGIRSNQQFNVTENRWENDILPILADQLCDLRFERFSKEALVKYLSGKIDANVQRFVDGQRVEDPEWDEGTCQDEIALLKELKCLHESGDEREREIADGCALARHLLTELFPAVLKTRGRVDHGLHKDNVVPFSSANTPSNTTFGYWAEAFCYYLMSGMQYDVTPEVWDAYVREQTEEANFYVEVIGGVPFDETPAAQAFFKFTGVLLSRCAIEEDRQNLLGAINCDVDKRVHLMRWLGQKKIRRYEKRVSASSVLFTKLFSRGVKTFSGTLKKVLPELDASLYAELSPRLDEIDGVVLARYVQQESGVVLAEEETPSSVVESALKGRKPDEIVRIQSVINAGGLFKSIPNNLEVARQLFRDLRAKGHPLKALFFYHKLPGEDESRQPALLLDPEGEPVPIAAPTAEEIKRATNGTSLDDIFYYYDHTHTDGTDCPIQEGREGLLLVQDNTAADNIQALLRHRQFLSTQEMTTVVHAENADKLPPVDFGGGPQTLRECIARGDHKQAKTLLVLDALGKQAEESAGLVVTKIQESVDAALQMAVIAYLGALDVEALEEGDEQIREALREFIEVVTEGNLFDMHGNLRDRFETVAYLKGFVEKRRQSLLAALEGGKVDIKSGIGHDLHLHMMKYLDGVISHIEEVKALGLLPEKTEASVSGRAHDSGMGQGLEIQLQEQDQVRLLQRDQIVSQATVLDKRYKEGKIQGENYAKPLSGDQLLMKLSALGGGGAMPISEIFVSTQMQTGDNDFIYHSPIGSTGAPPILGKLFEGVEVYGTDDFVYSRKNESEYLGRERSKYQTREIHVPIFSPKGKKFDAFALVRGRDGVCRLLCLSRAELYNLKERLDAEPQDNVWLLDQAGNILGGSTAPLDFESEVLPLLINVNILGGDIDMCLRHIEAMDRWMDRYPAGDAYNLMMHFLYIRFLSRSEHHLELFQAKLEDKHVRQALITRKHHALEGGQT